MSFSDAMERLDRALGVSNDPQMAEIMAAFRRASETFDLANAAYAAGNADLGRSLGNKARALADEHKLLTAAYQAKHRTKH